MFFKALVIYLIIINMYTALVFARDKQRAKKHQWRIPERTLLLLCLIGGSAGGLLSMYLLRHKTRHSKFYLGVPFILAAQLALFYMVYGTKL